MPVLGSKEIRQIASMLMRTADAMEQQEEDVAELRRVLKERPAAGDPEKMDLLQRERDEAKKEQERLRTLLSKLIGEHLGNSTEV